MFLATQCGACGAAVLTGHACSRCEAARERRRAREGGEVPPKRNRRIGPNIPPVAAAHYLGKIDGERGLPLHGPERFTGAGGERAYFAYCDGYASGRLADRV